jgi:hypothetical protein
VTAVLIHVDPEWPMPGLGGTVSPRRLRVWRTDIGAVWVVVTERGAGTSITNVAEVVVPLIRARYPGARVVEHYPPEPGSLEHFDEIVFTAECLRLRRIPVEEIVALLGRQAGRRCSGTAKPTSRPGGDRAGDRNRTGPAERRRDPRLPGRPGGSGRFRRRGTRPAHTLRPALTERVRVGVRGFRAG